jgi:ADP-ribosylation factor protein 1
MGNLITRLLESFSSKDPKRLLMLGLDAAGKTTILYRLKLGETLVTIPTIGINIETVEYKNLKWTIWDFGGHKKLMDLFMKNYLVNNDAIIYVLDSSDE